MPLQRIRRYPAFNVALVFGLLLIVLALWTVASGGEFVFFTALNQAVLAQQIPVTAIVAIGVGLLMIAGEFDVSVAATFTFASFLTVYVFNHLGWPAPMACLAGLLGGAAIGLTNGWITCWLRIPSFIATIGMMFAGRGLVSWISINPATGLPGGASFYPSHAFQNLLAGELFGPVYAQLVWLVVIAIAGYLILNRHQLGNHFFTVGGNAEAARSMGVNVRWVKLTAFVTCGITAAFAGILQAARIHEVDPASVLSGLELKAIAAVVLGGVSLFGGRGTILGMVLGAALLEVIFNASILLNIDSTLFGGFLGAIIILAAILNAMVGRRQES
jgi:simple sugar transport system permease protein